ncbi:NLI interacting factor-like phosphatase family protein [Tritrichomonas foetus]|uniref:Mitochondrial import inner membrane translocase subunit TIM50 n=1 Tax=Tritrichomonas foetus TaxID=1144522 RepID=A0A1J4JNS2_9EUKA|nr:NLI interacting factor-like phosphatase family protein [Tritrichomonas foetus]|eukprot:OHS98916.1 NLI interacting factor-like phosphatase family protein [Tritrichomonas foetus]
MNHNINSAGIVKRGALVLDLDETLVTSSVLPTRNDECFTIRFNRRRIFIRFRPGMKSFYSAVKEMFDIYIFTASDKKYANQVIDLIDDQIPHNHRFFRDDCTCMSGYFVKDLLKIGRDLNEILLVDDTEGCAMKQPNNLLRVTPWFGNQDDNELQTRLLPLLKIFNDEAARINILSQMANICFFNANIAASL